MMNEGQEENDGWGSYYDNRDSGIDTPATMAGPHRGSWPSPVRSQSRSFMGAPSDRVATNEPGSGPRDALFLMGFGATFDGVNDAGPASMSTSDMLFAFQILHPDMIQDGLFGPESLAMIDAEFARGFVSTEDGTFNQFTAEPMAPLTLAEIGRTSQKGGGGGVPNLPKGGGVDIVPRPTPGPNVTPVSTAHGITGTQIGIGVAAIVFLGVGWYLLK